MLLEIRALLYPADQNGFLLSTERQVRCRWRHPVGVFLGHDAMHKFTTLGTPCSDCPASWAARQRRTQPFFGIKAQIRYPGLCIRPVTGETPVRQNGSHIQAEAYAIRDPFGGVLDVWRNIDRATSQQDCQQDGGDMWATTGHKDHDVLR